MLIQISDRDQEWRIDIPIDNVTQEAFLLQSLRGSVREFRERFRSRLARQLPIMLYESLDPGLHSPTERQVAFAVAISRVLGIAIPSDAMRYKEAMSEFIEHHAELFRSRVARDQAPS
jgi:hypothetical protein